MQTTKPNIPTKNKNSADPDIRKFRDSEVNAIVSGFQQVDDNFDVVETELVNIAEPDLDQFIEVGGRYRVTKLHITPPSAIVDFTTWGKIGATNSPVYDNAITFNEASIIEANADQLKTWVIIGSFNAVPAIISSPPAFLNITGSILTGYANLNRLVFELVMIDAVPKVNLVITQWTGANADPLPEPSLGLWYEFEETAGNENTFLDSSRYGNNGIQIKGTDGSGVPNITLRSVGINGNALETVNDNSGETTVDIGRIDHSSSISLEESFTISAWINLNNLLGINGIFQKDRTLVAGTGITIWIDTDGRVQTRINNSVSSSIGTGGRLYSNFTFTVGIWTHVTYRYDRGVGLSIFINGVLDSSLSTEIDCIPSDEDAFLGINVPLLNTYRNIRTGGKIDQIKFWKRAISDAEILAEYNEFAP